MPLRSVTAKRMTLIFRGMASLELADFPGGPVRVWGGTAVVPDVFVTVTITVAGVIQTCFRSEQINFSSDAFERLCVKGFNTPF